MIVAKFGGTSVSTPSRIQTICQIAKKESPQGLIIVVSALAGVTNLLLSLPSISHIQRERAIREIRKIHKLLVEEYFQNKNSREEVMVYIDTQINQLTKVLQVKYTNEKELLDKIASFGEIMSSFIIAKALSMEGISAMQIVTTDVIVTNEVFGSAEFLLGPTKTKAKKVFTPLLKKGSVAVTTGFIGATKKGKTTTLGRGGSDYSASIIGFCLQAKEIQIWTDVDGIFSADPRFVKGAKLFKTISFEAASELATFGARVLHPRTIKPAIIAGIPVRVLNTLNPQNVGTSIVATPKLQKPIRAVCAKRNIPLVNISSSEMLLQKGFLAKIFSVFSKHHISIDLVSVSEVSVSVTLDNNDHLEETINELKTFSTVTTTKDRGIVSIIGDDISHASNTIAKIFATLHTYHIPVDMVSLGATSINISLVLDNAHIENAVQYLHESIVEKE